LTFKNRDLRAPVLETPDPEDDDSDEEFLTPAGTPPNEFDFDSNLDSINLSKYYSNFDLSLNNLQVLSGRFDQNLKFYLSKGHSNFHLLEKFDINIQLGILMKVNLNKEVSFFFNPQLPPVRISCHVDLLKLNIDDVKVLNLYKTVQLFDGLFRSESVAKSDKFKLPFRLREVKQFLEMDVKLNEVDITMSVQGSWEPHEPIGHVDARSICELKIYMISSVVQLNNKFYLNFHLSLYNMVLIDARQIYGPDYQLLAASHENLLLGTHTGGFLNRLTGLREDLSKNLKPLISIELTLTSQVESANLASLALEGVFVRVRVA
jgi:vacuolar protein sorting-associated protein 13D